METQNPSGQRLRWWTEETANTTAPKPQQKRWYNQPQEQKVVPPPIVAPPIVQHAAPPVVQQKQAPAAPLELWEELEAEAVRRAELEAQSVVMEGNARQIIATTRKRWAWTVLPAILFCAAIMLSIHSWTLLPMVSFLVLEVLLLDWMVRSMYKKGSPRMSLSPLGMTLQMPNYTLGPIFWDEIKSIRVRRFMYGSYLEIDLKDKKTTYARALRTHDKDGKSVAWFLNKTRKLTLMDTVFSTPAKEIATQISRIRPDLLETKKRR